MTIRGIQTPLAAQWHDAKRRVQTLIREGLLTGILASLANPLAQATVSIFAISTFDTDYLMVKQSDFEKAVEVLSKAGHEVFS